MAAKKNAKMIFSLSDTINYKKQHVAKDYAKNPTKLHKGNIAADVSHKIYLVWARIWITLTFNPLTAKLFNLNFHPLEVVSR